MEKDTIKPAPNESDESALSPHAESTSSSSLSKDEVREKAREARDQARDTIARTHQALDRNRKVMQNIEERTQRANARREREAEQRAINPSRSSLPFPTFENYPLSPSPLEILLIEENTGDIHLFHEALRECETSCRVSHLTDANEILSFVRREGAFADSPCPQLIILDLII